MKIHKFLLLSSLSFILMACSDKPIEQNETDEPDIEEVTELEATKEEIEEAIAEEPEETMEIDEVQLLENVGEYKFTPVGRVELLKIIRPTVSYKFTNGVSINFNDIKIMHHSEIPENEKEFHRDLYGFDDEGYSIQFSYSASNDTEQKIGGIEILDIVTSEGNQYNLYNNAFYLDGSNYEVRPNATANVGLVFAIENPDINSLDLYFQPLDKDGYHLDESSIHLSF